MLLLCQVDKLMFCLNLTRTKTCVYAESNNRDVRSSRFLANLTSDISKTRSRFTLLAVEPCTGLNFLASWTFHSSLVNISSIVKVNSIDRLRLSRWSVKRQQFNYFIVDFIVMSLMCCFYLTNKLSSSNRVQQVTIIVRVCSHLLYRCHTGGVLHDRVLITRSQAYTSFVIHKFSNRLFVLWNFKLIMLTRS